MPRLAAAFALLAALCIGLAPARAAVVVTVNKTTQRLSVSVDGAQRYEWPVSTARRGYRTPNGTYKPEWLARKHFSREYDWSPMPYSIFFNEGYAIHGSYEVSRLGSPASHGCIRLHPDNAAVLFGLVKEHMADTTIVVTGERPEKARVRDEDDEGETRRARHKRHREAETRSQAQQPMFSNQGNSWHSGEQQFFIFGPPLRQR